METKISLEALTLADIQPSQFYISEEKLRRVLTWFDPADLRSFEPCPVYEFQGKAVFTDGHTRAFAAYRAGLTKIPLVWETEDLSWEQYAKCVEVCRLRGVESIADLEGRVLPPEVYAVRWLGWCGDMQEKALYLGFRGTHNPFAGLMQTLSPESCLLTNSFAGVRRDLDRLPAGYDRAILFGVDPALRDGVRIEALAEGEGLRESSLDLTGLSARLTDAGIPNVISHRPVHDLCNEAYSILLERFSGAAALIHIPCGPYFPESMIEKMKLVFA